MPERPVLGAIVRIDGELYECVGIATGVTVIFHRVGAGECSICGNWDRRSYLLDAPNYQSEVKPVVTVPT